MRWAVGIPAVEPKTSRGKNYSPKVAKTHFHLAKCNNAYKNYLERRIDAKTTRHIDNGDLNNVTCSSQASLRSDGGGSFRLEWVAALHRIRWQQSPEYAIKCFPWSVSSVG